jgi:hypothetical protein
VPLPPKESVFTPFLRRFTDERMRDKRELAQLHDSVRARFLASPYADRERQAEFILRASRSFYDDLPDTLKLALLECFLALFDEEPVIFSFPETDLSQLTLKGSAELSDFLRAKDAFLSKHDEYIVEYLDCLENLFVAVTGNLPKIFGPSPFTIPLIYALPTPKQYVENIIRTFWQQKFVDSHLFIHLSRQIYLNLCWASDLEPFGEHKRPFRVPTKHDGLLHDVVEAYLQRTPFLQFFNTPVPLQFTHQERFNHMHIIGGSGAGKTTLLENLIVHDLESDDPPALIIVDSHGDLLSKLSRLDCFHPEHGKLRDRLIMISPKDIDHPPALNIFDINQDRIGQYDKLRKEQVVNGVIQTFDYLFAGLLGADLTAKQGVFFRYVSRLLLALPETLKRNATILDMIELMEDIEPYRPAIDALPPIQRGFFIRDFQSKTFAQTKEQIRYRLQAILENPTIAQLFTSPTTKLDLFTEINRGSIIFVDTAKDFLKGSSSHFGRIFISLVLQAVLERAAIPEDERKPAFLIVDEAASYFDSNIDDLLTEARKYKVGCVFAHQFLDQCTQSLKASLAANTAIKFAGSVSVSDARQMAPEMRTESDFILGQPKLHFAAHIRNVTPQAVSIPIPLGVVASRPRLSDEDYHTLEERNRLRVSVPQLEPSRLAPASPPSSSAPADDVGTGTSSEW